MSHKRPRSWGNPDLRHQTQVPAPPIAQIEQQLFSLLTPGCFKPLRLAQGEKKRRDRLLTLPVMMAVVLSLVYRQIPGLSEILRVLHLEGLLWVEPLSVSKQALSKRLRTIPAALFAQLFEQVMQRIQSTKTALPAPQGWELVQQNFTALWIADGSTLEALRRKLKVLKDQTTTLGGKMMMVVEAFNHQPVATWYTEKASANDKTFADDLLARLPVGGWHQWSTDSNFCPLDILCPAQRLVFSGRGSSLSTKRTHFGGDGVSRAVSFCPCANALGNYRCRDLFG